MKNKTTLFLFCMAIVNAQILVAQTKKVNTTNSEKKTKNAIIAKKETEKAKQREATLIKMNQTDSLRVAVDSINELANENARAAYLDSGLAAVNNAALIRTKEIAAATEGDYAQANYLQTIVAVKQLSQYEQKQVILINKEACYKANAIFTEADTLSNKEKLKLINQQRLKAIEATIGKKKTKIIENNRKSYAKKAGMPAEMKWIAIAEQTK